MTDDDIIRVIRATVTRDYGPYAWSIKFARAVLAEDAKQRAAQAEERLRFADQRSYLVNKASDGTGERLAETRDHSPGALDAAE
jgi:hypothetical protein